MAKNDSNEDNVTQSLESVFRGASFFSAGYVLSNIFGFVTQLLLTRLLGATGYGMYSFARTGILLARRVSNLGSNQSLMRYLPAYADNPAAQEDTLTVAYLTSTVSGIFMATTMIFAAPTISQFTLDSPLFVDILRLFALTLVFDTLMQVTAHIFRAVELAKYDVMLRKIVWHASLLVAAIISFLLGLEILETTIAVVIASALTLFYGLYLSSKKLDISPSWRTSNINLKEYYNYSLPLSAKDMGGFFYTRTDILMVGIFLSASSVGIYNIAILLAGVVILPASAVSQLFPPIVSKLYSQGQNKELNEVYTAVSRWTFTCSIPLFLGAVIYRDELLLLFGAEFAVGGAVLIILAIGKIINSLIVQTSYLLMMTHHQYLVFINQWLTAIINIILNYLLILEFGLIGAAYASTISLIILDIMRIAEAWKFEGMTPFSWDLSKPILATIPCAGTMFFLPTLLPITPIVAMFIAGASGIGIFVLTLFLLGANKADKKLYKYLR